ERLDISLSRIISIKFLVRKNVIFCSAGNSPRRASSTVQSGLDVRGSIQSRMNVFVEWRGWVSRLDVGIIELCDWLINIIRDIFLLVLLCVVVDICELLYVRKSVEL